VYYVHNSALLSPNVTKKTQIIVAAFLSTRLYLPEKGRGTLECMTRKHVVIAATALAASAAFDCDAPFERRHLADHDHAG
jgi:hypothetical protein